MNQVTPERRLRLTALLLLVVSLSVLGWLWSPARSQQQRAQSDPATSAAGSGGASGAAEEKSQGSEEAVHRSLDITRVDGDEVEPEQSIDVPPSGDVEMRLFPPEPKLKLYAWVSAAGSET